MIVTPALSNAKDMGDQFSATTLAVMPIRLRMGPSQNRYFK
jgi:hypothetical protein